MELTRLEPEHVGNGTTLRAFFDLDDYQLETLFTRSITGGLEYQLPHGGVGAVSSPRLSIDEVALSVIFDWMEFLLPKAQAAGLNKRTSSQPRPRSRGRHRLHSCPRIQALLPVIPKRASQAECDPHS
jgi:hypothetical protein